MPALGKTQIAVDATAPATTRGAAHRIHATLRDDIIHMRLRPLDILAEKQLVTRFGVSRTPIREALLRLADEGLVEIVPQSGTRVARIPASALREAILIRTALEATTVSLAIAGSSDEAIALLRSNQRELAEAAGQGDIARIHVIDTAFHQLIAEIAGCPGIWSVIERSKIQLDRYRSLVLPQSGRITLVVDEHAAVIEAIAAGNDRLAVEAMRLHIGRMIEEIEEHDMLDPMLFVDDRQRVVPAWRNLTTPTFS
ncbi:GntR family transcriptional regulator [Rhizobium sp. G187]|uniref:GntR family transcriptional regulator n=1 Tax=Rhizobium sp. G187 TaxID=3451352 RepID=UPI003EE4A537